VETTDSDLVNAVAHFTTKKFEPKRTIWLLQASPERGGEA